MVKGVKLQLLSLWILGPSPRERPCFLYTPSRPWLATKLSDIWEFSDGFSKSTSRALPKFRESAHPARWLETALFKAPAGNSPLS